jgi:hypothetical protein
VFERHALRRLERNDFRLAGLEARAFHLFDRLTGRVLRRRPKADASGERRFLPAAAGR